MMLGVGDLAAIVTTSLVCTAAVGGVGWLLLRALRRAPILGQLLVVAGAGIVAMTASVLAISVEMYLSEHDLTVLIAVILVSCVFGALAAWALARTVQGSTGRLVDSARRIASGERVEAEAAGAHEFATVSRELSEVAERVRTAREELEQLDSARRRFFAWISHDLRTPLTAMRALAEAAEADPEADARLLAAQVTAQTDSMTRLVDDLFELSRLSSGSLRLRTQQIDLLDVVSEAVADVRAAAERRGVRIVERGIAGHQLWADPHRLGRVIVNLLANAVRHAPAGSDIVVSATELDAGRLVLGVLDRGSGVAVEDLDRMFEVGWRADAARTPDDGTDGIASGAGLGLAIARGLARAHGGDVTAERTPEGFRMNVLLPTGGPAAA